MVQCGLMGYIYFWFVCLTIVMDRLILFQCESKSVEGKTNNGKSISCT